MLKIDNHNVNFAGQSMFHDNSVLASFSASFYGSNDINTSVNIMNYNIDDEAQEILLADISSFYQEVLEKVNMLAIHREEPVEEEIPVE